MNNKHNNPERDQFQAPDGAEIALWRWPQSKARPTLHWAHATGFHGRLYHPLLDELATDFNVLAWDMRDVDNVLSRLLLKDRYDAMSFPVSAI